jgi:hypothetical protein
MNEKELKLISKLLRTASNEFLFHYCNDIPNDIFDDWTEDEMYKLSINMSKWDDPNAEDDGSLISSDYILMKYFADKLENEVGK